MRNELETKNAKIVGTNLLLEDHGFLTIYLELEYAGGSRQSFGGYALQNQTAKLGIAGHFILKLFEVTGKMYWREITDSTIRVKARFDKVESIGHILDDIWFNPSEEYKNI